MTTADSKAGDCPVLNFDYLATKPAGGWRQTYDELREQFPWFRNDFGSAVWMMVDYEGIIQVLQDNETFSNSVVSISMPEPPFKAIPLMLDGDEHKQWRRQLGPLFAPGVIGRLEDTIRERTIDLIEPIADRGSCDFISDFAEQLPTTIFLELMGLPVGELDQFLKWEHAILHAGSNDQEHLEQMATAMFAVMGRFQALIAERREDPRDDIVSKALEFEIDGEPVTEADLLSFCVLMFIAGLDTVTAALGWVFHHFAHNDEDRAQIVADPTLIPSAVEECLRAYAIVVSGRKVTKDVEVNGCPMKAGDLVGIPMAAATRDETQFPNAKAVDILRKPNRHIAFGAGPHRCLGSHLARLELKVVLEEWHKRIPNYGVPADAQLTETGMMLALNELPLFWGAESSAGHRANVRRESIGGNK